MNIVKHVIMSSVGKKKKEKKKRSFSVVFYLQALFDCNTCFR